MTPSVARRALVVLAAVLLGGAGVPAAASAGATSYSRCDAVPGAGYVGVARVGCAAVQEVATAAAAARPDDEEGVLAGFGWTAMRAAPIDGRRARTHELIAVRGRAALRLRRDGVAPSLDGWAAGRELVFARGTIVGGRPVPKGAAFCTSAFLVRRPGGALAGLSAAHCGGLRSDGQLQRANVALRRPPQAGIVLGRVLRVLTRKQPLDALVVPVTRRAHRTATAVVNRGVRRPPLPVVGPARPTAGRRVCFAGRTSGSDQCGRIRGVSSRGVERLFLLQGLIVRCTTIRARQGDSGGPVYTAPDKNGAVRAVGIVTLIAGPRAQMCFTPLDLVLDRAQLRIVTAG